jgi:hypothetical protein
MSMTTSPSPRPNYTLTDAAHLVGVSRSTIRRRREQGKFPDAFKTHDGEWMIPLTNLLADGLRPSSPDHAQAEQDSSASAPVTLTPLAQAAQSVAQAEHAQLQERLQYAERDLAVERAKNEGLAQTLAATEKRATDLSLALRMIEQSKPTPAEPAATPPAPALEVPAEPEPRRRWWQW